MLLQLQYFSLDFIVALIVCWGLFHNGQTFVPLRITLHEIGFPQPIKPIKVDNSVAEVIVTTTVRRKMSKATDMQFYLMKERLKQK